MAPRCDIVVDMATTFTTFTAEFTVSTYEQRANTTKRLVTCTKETGGVRVHIQCEGAGYAANAPFVTLSNELIPDAQWETVKGYLKQTTGFKVVKRG